MKYSRLTDTFTITADDGGADSKLTIKNISGNAFGESSAFGISEGTTKNGQNAKVTISDGTTTSGVTQEKDSNAFTIDGLTYQLNDTTSSDISFQVERDYSTTVDAIQKFVDSLNTVITTITGYTTGKDNSADYPPLTESQKDDMTDDEIEKWETTAKTGILRHGLKHFGHLSIAGIRILLNGNCQIVGFFCILRILRCMNCDLLKRGCQLLHRACLLCGAL